MSLVTRMVNAVSRGALRKPRTGVLLNRRKEDSWREYPADGLTPQRLVSILREADGGSPASQLALYEQMEEKDAHLFSVANTRRLAVTGLHWEIVSAAQMPGWGAARSAGADATQADAAAAYCDAALRAAAGFEESLAQLALAIGRNISLAELVWEASGRGIRLSEVRPVDFGRITFDELGEPRVLRDANDFEGLRLPPAKFVVHAPNASSGHAMRGGILRATALAFLGKHFAIKDWLIFAEVFGMPVRIAKYSPNASVEEKREMLEMLKQLGADATGVFSKAVELEVIQSRTPGEVNLYENLCLYFDREISKAWLGQTLTTDTSRMLASAGAAGVHDHVRRDLRDDDLRRESTTIRRDLLTPMARLEFGPAAPVPYFRRVVETRFEPESLSRTLDVAVNQLGARVPRRWVHAALGIPEAGADEPVLPGAVRSNANG